MIKVFWDHDGGWMQWNPEEYPWQENERWKEIPESQFWEYKAARERVYQLQEAIRRMPEERA